MGTKNRGRVEVLLNDKWRLYVPEPKLPSGMHALGTVTVKGIAGALVHVEATGAYVQVRDKAIRMLNRRKVIAALSNAKGGEDNS